MLGNQLEFCVKGELGRQYTIEASADLLHWTLISTVVKTNGSIMFIDPAKSNFHKRLYRLNFEP